ncbi:T9SS type A sorting domain-containing protein [Portibacter marinus]|uniref:T9SS type A sorting domain-containing protein n=1 Tax=Portibacter marinus TaxID=2898660 RepID=UPI001F3D65C9|nr:T9SS type A sorting domain-containing protein [Portibacter marinus]
MDVNNNNIEHHKAVITMKNWTHIIFLAVNLWIGYQIIDFHYAEALETQELTETEKKNRGKKGENFHQPKADAPEMYGIIDRQLRTPLDVVVPEYPENYLAKEYRKAKKNASKKYLRNELNFISRGPANIGGRTRAILVDPRDETKNTWIAGSASGGAWKTKDAGKSWSNISSDFTSLSTNTLAMSQNNPDIIYAGTGEHFVDDTDGNGLWKSEDGGQSWRQIASPEQYDGFKNVARIVIDPSDDDVVLVATSNSWWVETNDYAIWKSVDGGESFTRKYTSELGRVDDLNANPENFNTIYAALRGYGVIKSLNGGETWFEPGPPLPGVGRVEIDVSHVDTSRVWASAEGGPSAAGSTVFLSIDGGQTYSPLNAENEEINYLGGQGWYDNIITAHPFKKEEAYVGGVNLFKVSVTGTGDVYTDLRVEQDGTRSFLTFITGTNFQSEARIPEEEWKSVEVRFGQGSQKAYRFTVGGQGAGVPFGNYVYEDYVDVPFTVFDTESGEQLAVSFRDQQDDGEWNLLPSNTSDDPSDDSRDYIFIHDAPYTEDPIPEIAQVGGTEFRLMYFIWPALQDDADIEQNNYPESELKITVFEATAFESATTVLADAYGSFNGINNFSAENFINHEGLHPDHHNLLIIIESEEEQTFRLLSANDGGVYITKVSEDPGSNEGDFIYGSFGYITSQFYGADKAPGENRYIGGMQDNSTWFTPQGVEANTTSKYLLAFGGDGFESIWNNANPNLIIGGAQFNSFQRSLDNGKTWIRALDSLTEGGPFISRLANSKRYPNRLFTVGPSGVWRSENFGGEWQLTEIPEGWSFSNSADVEVSHADSSVIWAGGFLGEERRVFVSRDNGLSFNPVSNYDGVTLGSVSGIGTHASDPSIAYLLFSFSGRPKVLKTSDFGETWTDISGFAENDGVSSRGFPDVAIQSLLVFPNDTNRIWVGSEIGIIESLDDGLSWNLLQSNMPPVYVHEFKIQDDQIVMATYGRGIWTVEIDGIEQNYILDPSVTRATQDLTEGLTIDYYLPTEYDSSRIIVNESLVKTVGPNEKGGFEERVLISGLEGEVVIEIESFIGDEVRSSMPYIIQVFIPGEVTKQYENDFSNLNRADEFVGGNFRFALIDGFAEPALHSDHPYVNATDYIHTLTIPFLLSSETNNELQFREVAIIEPGEEGSVFGDTDFWDYVVVEGSQDGQQWTALSRGYDSRADEAWLSAFNNEEAITDDLYRIRNIRLENTYEIGDTILVRFRLHADQFLTGWGWAIDDLEIGDVTSNVSDVYTVKKVSIFPNPVSTVLNLEVQQKLLQPMVSIIDLSGRVVLRTDSYKHVNVSDLRSGTYFLNIADGDFRQTIKFIKI